MLKGDAIVFSTDGPKTDGEKGENEECMCGSPLFRKHHVCRHWIPTLGRDIKVTWKYKVGILMEEEHSKIRLSGNSQHQQLLRRPRAPYGRIEIGDEGGRACACRRITQLHVFINNKSR